MNCNIKHNIMYYTVDVFYSFLLDFCRIDSSLALFERQSQYGEFYPKIRENYRKMIKIDYK